MCEKPKQIKTTLKTYKILMKVQIVARNNGDDKSERHIKHRRMERMGLIQYRIAFSLSGTKSNWNRFKFVTSLTKRADTIHILIRNDARMMREKKRRFDEKSNQAAHTQIGSTRFIYRRSARYLKLRIGCQCCVSFVSFAWHIQCSESVCLGKFHLLEPT